jgi:hypothetical protein
LKIYRDLFPNLRRPDWNADYNFNLNIVFRLWLALQLRKALFGLGWCGNDDQAFAKTLKAPGAAAALFAYFFQL